MYMGARISLLLATQEYFQRASDVQYFLKRVQEFYIEAASQIKKRFPINAPEIAVRGSRPKCRPHKVLVTGPVGFPISQFDCQIKNAEAG